MDSKNEMKITVLKVIKAIMKNNKVGKFALSHIVALCVWYRTAEGMEWNGEPTPWRMWGLSIQWEWWFKLGRENEPFHKWCCDKGFVVGNNQSDHYLIPNITLDVLKPNGKNTTFNPLSEL